MELLLSYSFIQNAFLAGSLVAIVSACIGYFLLLRRLTFAGHALSHIGFAGATGALLFGIDPLFGMLSFTLVSGLLIGVIGKRLQERDISVGIVMMIMLGFGSLFISLYKGYAQQAYSILFGTILGVSRLDVVVTLGFTILVLCVLAFLFRPLLFSSFDSSVAHAKGVPIAFLRIVFLLLVAITVSMSVEVVGVLLVFTLLVGPAAVALRLADRPVIAIMLSIVFALSYVWIGISVAILTNIPVSFCIASISFGTYVVVRIWQSIWRKNV